MEIKDCTELKEKLATGRIIIYGAGYVAIRFFYALKKQGVAENVECFVITSGNKKELEGIEVKNIDELAIEEGMFFCIAVHESLRAEVESTLSLKGVSQYLWIYPFLNELILGVPIFKNKKVSVQEIWAANKNNYSIATRYLAVEKFYGQNDIGYEAYMSGLSLFNHRETSRKRLNQFVELINDWEKEGYNAEKPIVLLADGSVLDGFHRIAIAIFHQQKELICDMYPVPDDEESLHNPIALLTKDSVVEAGLDIELIEILQKTNCRIEERLYENKRNYSGI